MKKLDPARRSAAITLLLTDLIRFYDHQTVRLHAREITAAQYAHKIHVFLLDTTKTIQEIFE